MKINNDWVVGVEREPTKKMGGTINPIGIVYHYTAGWTTAGDVYTLAKSSRQASAHVVLGRDGELVQIVPFNRKAWHAGPSKYRNLSGLNDYFIGIEISNAGWVKHLSNGQFLDQYGQKITGTGQFVGQSRKTKSPPAGWHVQYHPRLASGQYSWEPFYPQQLDKLDELTVALLQTYPSIKYMVSHEEIDTRGWKTDPGPMFPMRRYLKMLEDRGADYAPAQDAPIVTPDDVPVFVKIWRPLREAPYEDAKIDGAFVTGQLVYVNKVDGKWSHVYGDGGEGWVLTEFLRPVNPKE
jgi:N-acetylmuramoyl-L-alanine amidase